MNQIRRGANARVIIPALQAKAADGSARPLALNSGAWTISPAEPSEELPPPTPLEGEALAAIQPVFFEVSGHWDAAAGSSSGEVRAHRQRVADHTRELRRLGASREEMAEQRAFVRLFNNLYGCRSRG